MVDPYLAQRDMDLRVSQSLSEAEHRGMARTAGANKEFSLGRLVSAVSVRFSQPADQVRNAANAIQTWYDEAVGSHTNA